MTPMKIAVLVKQVPDTWEDRRLDLQSGRVERDATDRVIDEIDERALEVALVYRDAHGAEVIAVAMGPQPAGEMLRKALATGADSALHVRDDTLEGADAGWTALVLATALRDVGADLVIAGVESTDGRGGVVPAMIAEHLGRPHLTALDVIEISADMVSGMRSTDHGVQRAHVRLPAVVSVTERSAEPRFPTFKGILRAKKKPLEVVTVADLGLGPALAALSASRVVSVARRPERAGGVIVRDDGTAAAQLTQFLAGRRLI
jgi:electron transfer flavoprotein beta subunit